VYLDGVYIARLSVSTADLIDVESIEVLRGPQGTLYGRNSTAGALLINTKRPTDEFSAELTASAAQFDEYRISGAVSGPITDMLSARAAIGYSDRGGFGDNIVDGSTVGGSEDFTARLSFNYDPLSDLSFTLISEYQSREAEPALIAATDLGTTGGVASPFDPRDDLNEVLDSNEFALNDPNSVDVESYSVTLLGEWDLGWATVNSVTSYRNWDLEGTQDSDSTGLQLFSNNGALTSEQFSQEIRLASNSDGRLSWIVGGFFMTEDTTVDFAIQNFNGLFGLGTNAIFDGEQTTDAYAVFADATFEIIDGLSITVGGRYSYEEKDFQNDQDVLILNGGTVPPIPPAGPLGGLTFAPGDVFAAPPVFQDTADFDDFSPRAVIDYQFTDTIFAYASYSQGFKSGGFNSFGLTPAFDPEEIDAYEIGFKSTFWDNRIRFNVSGFTYDYENLQLRLPVPTGGVDIQNVAEAEITGAEFEFTASPIEGLTFTTNLALLDTEINEGVLPSIPTNTPPFPIGIPLTLVDEDVSGNSLTRAPDVQVFVGLDYERPVGPFILGAAANYRYQDGVFFLETNQDASTFSNDSWNEVNLRFSVADADGRWEAAVFGQNVTDERYVTQVTALGGFPNASVSEPAKWGGQITLRY
ncbi:MAG: TonB-dependent receptor, partial [Pseudomonadota bacterium]